VLLVGHWRSTARWAGREEIKLFSQGSEMCICRSRRKASVVVLERVVAHLGSECLPHVTSWEKGYAGGTENGLGGEGDSLGLTWGEKARGTIPSF